MDKLIGGSICIMKTKYAVVLSLILVFLMVGVATAQKQDVTLTIYARAYTWNQDAPWEYAKAELQKRHPEINFTFIEEGFGWDDLRNKFLVTAGTDSAPDVVMVDTIWLGEYVDNGLIRDITEQALAWSEWDDIVDSFKESSKWNGRIYGIWLNTDVRVLAYNKKLFRAAGLDPDKPPTTWDELMEMAKAISDPPAVYGYAFPAMKEEDTAHRFYAFLHSAGGKILSDDMSEALFNSEAGVEALQFMVDLVNEEAASLNLGGTYSDIDRGLFLDRYAMSIMTKPIGLARDVIPGLTDEQYLEDFGVTAIPRHPDGEFATQSGGYLLAVPTRSKHPELAWELITLATGAKAQFDYTVARGYVPTRYSLMERAEDYVSEDPHFDVILKQLPYAYFRPSLPEYTEISNAIQDAIQLALLGRMTPKAALDQAAERVNAILANK
jgi:multiple sugar transport system substrate-binding protein